MWVVSTPLQVLCHRKSAFTLNLNQYRNAHYHLLDDAKKDFAKVVNPRIKAAGLPSLVRIRMSFLLYPRTKQLCDVSNICCIVDKFFSDCLVAEGIIPDDNYKHVGPNAYGFGEVDKTNPRVDVIIESLA